MRIISQDGTIDIPYDYFSLTIATGKYEDVEVAIIYCHNLSSPKGTKLAEYSSKEKAEKAMKMLRNACSGILIMKNIEPDEEAMNVIRNFGKDARVVAINAKNGSDVYPVNGESYFRFPADDI